MANVAKYTKSSTGLLCQHYERKQNENGEYIKFGNQDIDLSKTSENYNLAEHQNLNQISFINKRISEVKCLNRKENIISAYVHKDEKQPHLHFAFIPVTIGKDGKEKVSAKEVLTREELQKFHPDLQKHLGKELGYEVDILNGATASGNKTIHELKAEKEIENFNQQISKINKELTSKKSLLSNTEKQLKSIENDLLSYKEIKQLDGKKTIGGGLKGVSFSEYESLQKTALKASNLQKEVNRLSDVINQYSDVLEKAKSKIYHLEKSPEIFKLKAENHNLKNRLERLTEKTEKILDLLPEKEKTIAENIISPKRSKEQSLG